MATLQLNAGQVVVNAAGVPQVDGERYSSVVAGAAIRETFYGDATSGTVVGTAAYEEGRYGGRAFSFDGGTYIDTGSQYLLPTSDATLWARIKPGQQTSDTSSIIRPVIFQGLSSSNNLNLGVNRDGSGSGNFPRLEWDTASGSLSLGPALPEGQWSVLVAVKSGSQITLYVDGTLRFTATAGGNLATANTQIGGNDTVSARRFVGSVDEVGILTAPASIDTVAVISAGPEPTNPTASLVDTGTSLRSTITADDPNNSTLSFSPLLQQTTDGGTTWTPVAQALNQASGTHDFDRPGAGTFRVVGLAHNLGGVSVHSVSPTVVIKATTATPKMSPAARRRAMIRKGRLAGA